MTRDFFLWARWRLGHNEFKPFGPASAAHRPALPYGGKGQEPIPKSWWDEYKRRYVRTQPPLPAPDVGFASRGIFTAQDPSYALRVARNAWVAVRPDIVAPAEVAAFPRLAVWEAEAVLGQQAVDQFAAELYIAQAEGPGQLEAALHVGPSIKVPKALVTNVTFIADSPDAWPDGWVCLPEAYAQTNPNATPINLDYEARKRGATEVYSVLGLYDGTSEGGRRKRLAEYRTEWLPEHWSGYLAEGMTEDDWVVW